MEEKYQNQIIQLLKDSKNALNFKDILSQLQIPQLTLQTLLNALYQQHLVTVDQRQKGEIYFIYQNPDIYNKLKDLTAEEKIIFQLISDKQNNGTWSVELKNKSQLQSNQITKILSNLEKKLLIKSFKPVNFRNRKMWILYELQANDQMTGFNFYYNSGFFYSENEIDNQKIDDLQDKTFNFIQQRGQANKSEISIHLRSSQDLLDSHITQILQLMIYDDKIEEIPSELNPKNPSYSISQWNKIIKDAQITNTPCGICPVISICKQGNVISPENCIYFQDW